MNTKVLVVDDDETLGHLFVQVLARMKIDSDFVNNPSLALEVFQKGSFSLVLTDLEMHSDSKAGLKLILEIRKLNAKIPIIMITGKADDEIRALGIAHGANHVLHKLHDLDKLGGVIQKEIEATMT